MAQHRPYLELAMAQAEQASREGTWPIGAVLVGADGQVISAGRNRFYARVDTTAHAEVDALRQAGRALLDAPLRQECTLYTTVEPSGPRRCLPRIIGQLWGGMPVRRRDLAVANAARGDIYPFLNGVGRGLLKKVDRCGLIDDITSPLSSSILRFATPQEYLSTRICPLFKAKGRRDR